MNGSEKVNQMNGEDLRVRKAKREDCATILALMREFADYVNLIDSLVVVQRTLEIQLFENNAAEVLIAEVGDQPIGYALYFSVFSSFTGNRGIYLDDLFISPGYRNNGYGKALLMTLAKDTVEKGFVYIEWSCLNWNNTAINFYRSIGAHPHDDSTIYRLGGNTLNGFIS